MLDFSALPSYEWLDQPMWVFDAQRLCHLWANAAGLKFWRAQSLAELQQRNFSDMRETVQARLQVMAAEHARGQVVQEQWTLYPKDQPVTVMLQSCAIQTPDGRIAMLFSGMNSAPVLDKSLQRGVEALQHTSVRIAMFSLRDGSVLMRNPAAAMCFIGLPKEVGQSEFGSLFAQAELAKRVMTQVQRGQTFAAELELNTHKGPRWHSVDARPIRDPLSGELVMQFNARDIAELKHTQLALDAAREAAEQANQAKSAFLANISHEIRTPMTGVLGLTELVLQTDLTEKQRKFLNLAHSSAKALLMIINDLLDVAKIESGRLHIEIAPFSLHECLKEALHPLLLQAHEKGITLNVRIQPGLPAQLMGDALRLRQVLMNLIGNALKFTEKGEVRVEIRRLDAVADDGPERLHLAVHDTGIGMTQEQIAQIFAPFSQADHSISRRYGGTGLGLTIVQRLVQLMGSQVQVESQPGIGSCFSFELPLQAAPPMEDTEGPQKAAEPSSDHRPTEETADTSAVSASGDQQP